jgi:hypothetical protein
MLSIDNNIYDLLEGGEGITKTLNIDSFFGKYVWAEGKNVSLRFSDASGTYNETFSKPAIGSFSYNLDGRDGVLIQEGDHAYLKGPRIQRDFFVNSTGGGTYQGLSNLTLLRPLDKVMIISLDYRIGCYYWYDTINDVLSITVSIIQLETPGLGLSINGYYSLNIFYDSYETVYTASTNVDTNFYLEGSILPGFASPEQVITFLKPLTVVNYDVNMEVIVTHISLFV